MSDKVPASGNEPTSNGSTPTLSKLDDGQFADHWILSDEDRAKGFVRPVRYTYVHSKCGVETRMGSKIAETYAAVPVFYNSTFCVGCHDYFPVGVSGEFTWDDGSKVGS